MMNSRRWKRIGPLLIWALFAAGRSPAAESGHGLPAGFVYLDETVPGIVYDLRYATSDNFLGVPVDGYQKARCIISLQAAEGLRQIQEELARFGLGLKIFDAYRPQRAVDHFVRWAGDPADVRMKEQYYPGLVKSRLIPDGYIAKKSGHSRGSTVDLTIVYTGPDGRPAELDMGSGFDFFGLISRPESNAVSSVQRAHRLLLQTLMIRHGFYPYREEWWHFTLENEPFPETYFDFPVQ